KRARRSSCAGAAPAPKRTGARRNTSRQPWRFTELCYNRAVKPLPLAVLDRYIMRELVSPFALGVTLFTFFLVLDRIYNLTELVITKGVPFHLVVQLLVFMLPSFLPHTLPMALLVSVLLAGARLAVDLEVVDFQASGPSRLRICRPCLL